MKLILCDGDSWTAGDIINPELKLINENHANVNDPLNDSYRLPKVWPHKLGKLLNIDTLNIAHAGSSNDAIVRRTMRKVKELLLDYEAKDLFVIIGWSSPERKDFYCFVNVFVSLWALSLSPLWHPKRIKKRINKQCYKWNRNFNWTCKGICF